jgi:L-gulonate 3-dehydrogenase
MRGTETKGRIAVVGTGLVGSGWAIVFARAGLAVSLYDVAPGAAERALTLIGERLKDLQKAGLTGDPVPIHARVTVASSLKDALEGAIYVQESVLERVDVKTELMTEIDALVGAETYIGSSSSGIGASHFTEHVACRGRCLVAHPVNPPYLAPIVELVPSPWTAHETILAVRRLMEEVGQTPVEMTREAEGFILNRLQGVLLMEAWRLVEQGLATAEDVDKTVSQGLGLRWAFMGPFETIDLNAPGGIADYAIRLGGLYQRIASSTTEHRVWDAELIERVEAQRRKLLAAGDLPSRGAWRDRRLMALARHKQEQDAADPHAQNTKAYRS